MEKETLKTAMKDSISEVLEKMFFVPLNFSEHKSPYELWKPGKDKVLVTELGFQGPFSGTVISFIPEENALSLAADFLGENAKEVPAQHGREIAQEITNMVSGNTFRLLDSQSVFDLETPKMSLFEKAAASQVDWVKEIFVSLQTTEGSMAFGMVVR